MNCAETHIKQTLNQESEKPTKKFLVADQSLTGWTDNPVSSQKTSSIHQVRKNKSISQKIRSNTPTILSKRIKNASRQQSMQVKYGTKDSENLISFKDIEKNFLGVQNSMTPKLRNLVNSINRAKINKMNEVIKKNRGNGNLTGSIRIQSISPYRKLFSPGFGMQRHNGVEIIKMKELENTWMKNLKY